MAKLITGSWHPIMSPEPERDADGRHATVVPFRLGGIGAHTLEALVKFVPGQKRIAGAGFDEQYMLFIGKDELLVSAERAFRLAERLAAAGTGETPSPAGPFLSKGDLVTEPRDLTDLVPAEVRTELAAAVAALELHGPAITTALRRLDQATTAAWHAVHPADPTQDEWRLVERRVGIDRGWNAAYQLVATLDPPGQGRSPT